MSLSARLQRAERALHAIAHAGVVEIRAEDLAPILGMHTARGARLLVAELQEEKRLTRSLERGRGVPLRLELLGKPEQKAEQKEEESGKKGGTGGGKGGGPTHVHASPVSLETKQGSCSSCTRCEVTERVLRALVFYPERKPEQKAERIDVKPVNVAEETPEETIALDERAAQLAEKGQDMGEGLRHTVLDEIRQKPSKKARLLAAAQRRTAKVARANAPKPPPPPRAVPAISPVDLHLQEVRKRELEERAALKAKIAARGSGAPS